MDGWQLLYSVSVLIILAIPRFGSLAVLNSAAVTCRHLRHFGNFRGAGFGLAPTSLGLAPTGRRLPEGSGGQGTRIPTPPLVALSLNLTTVSRASQGVSPAKTKILRTSRRRTRYGRVCAYGVLTNARFSEQPKKKLCRRSCTTVPIDEGPEVAHLQPHLQERVLEHSATPAWGATS